MSVMTIPLRSQRESVSIPRVNDLTRGIRRRSPRPRYRGPRRRFSAAAPAVRCTPIPTSSRRRG